MDNFIIEILPICLSVMGGAILIVSIFTFMGKADILLDFERKHFAKKFLSKLAKIESAFGLGIKRSFRAKHILRPAKASILVLYQIRAEISMI